MGVCNVMKDTGICCQLDNDTLVMKEKVIKIENMVCVSGR